MAHAFVTVVVPFEDRNSDTVDTHLDGLGNLARPPIAEALDASEFVHFMSLTVVRGSAGMSVRRIRHEAALASRIQHILDERSAEGPALATLARVRARLFAEGVYKWAFVAEPAPLLADAPKGWSFVWPMFRSALRTF